MSDQQPGLAQAAPPPGPPGQTLNVSGQSVRIQQVLSAAGQQFVLASGQMVPTSAANMTRLSMVTGRGGTVQLTPTKVGTTGAAVGTTLVSIAQPSVNASSYPTLVNSLSSPSRRPPSSPTSTGSPQRKRPRLMNEPVSEEVLARRRLIAEHKKARMKSARPKYAQLAAELFFLQIGGNMADFVSWRKRPPTAQFLHFLRSNRLDPEDSDEDLTQCLSPLKTASATTGDASCSPPSGGSTTPVQASQSQSTSVPDPSEVSGATTATTTPSTTSRSGSAQDGQSPDRRTGSPSKLRGQTPRPKPLQNHEASPSSQEHIVEKAKQEAYVMQRIVELQREGLWTERRLPKVQEPPRGKAHWDYLLEEMVWLAADFAQERKWKKAAAKKCARMVQKHFHEKQMNAQRAEKNQELRLKKIASAIAKEVKNFWANIEKLVEFKQQTKLEEKRKQALDQQLSYIVDQTEKYSMLLTEGMNRAGGESGNNSATASVPPSVVSYSSNSGNEAQSDDDFRPDMDSEDDERTIAKDEDVGGNPEEILALQQQSEMSLEDILKDLPGYLDSRDSLLQDGSSSRPSTPEDDESEEEEEEDDEEEEEEEDEEEEEEEEVKEEEPKTGPGLNELYKKSPTEEDTDKEINNVAAMAESIQPKGNTLSSTDVVTKIPFLLKHSLREYQHIGLDWLVTMYDRSLNGILADEMGLGKTIQTISLLAHLACEKEDWGPHLIIVPTSVMLNWEMELKKWCPGFKILTYYGTQKERRTKRTGWTKPNAFHVCITSYKLVIQDHQSFRRKKWKYLILDEAQNIKNFKSQRWQLLLNFQTQRRLLLTGTPLQNNLMELWSLMHFLMPHVFQSHREFKEWFSNPVTGMIEGNSEYNESIIKRLHKVLRPFLLRRLKCEVEKQLPKKYEHIVMCRLSKRQRYLYDDFMSRTKTQETLASGNLLSVINVLMQLRKVCNHPNLFEVRPTTSPFQMEGLNLHTASLVYGAIDYDVWTHVNLSVLNLNLIDLEGTVSAFTAHRVKRYRTPARLIEEIDALPGPPPPCPKGRLNVTVRVNQSPTPLFLNQHRGVTTLDARVGTSPAPLRKTGKNVGNFLQRSSVIAKSSSPSSVTNRINSRPVLRVPPMNIADAQGSNGAVQSRSQASPTKPDEGQSDFFLPQLHQRRKLLRKEKLRRLERCNARRCEVCPIYGEDLVEAFGSLTAPSTPSSSWSDGVVHCHLTHRCDVGQYWRGTTALSSMLHTPQDYVDELRDLFSRFVLWVPAVSAPAPQLHVSHPPPSKFWAVERSKADLQREWGPRCSILHPVASAMVTQFPDPRLIQYDCGKLQTMDRLLRQLKAGHHRVLIFTQMTRMLDVLEAFLNFHGHIYLRLDGTTRVDQRQMVMERFNSDPRIFCMILSTRSGGVGVNLTGADTVIFYDSDWNPTMDAQAQDRCHRIGQTRDVNIYRLISEKTVEENILKKANQKRLLGNLAIEGGNFTTAFFKSSTIQDLFDVDVSENDASRRMAEVVDKDQVPAADDKVALGALESALAAAEDESDVIALKSAKAEAVADLEEFDESVPLSEEGAEGEQPELSKAEQEVQNLVQQLTGVERYAMTFLEQTDSWSAKQLAEAEAEIERQKRDWEMNRLANAREEEQRRRSLMDDPEPMLTYSREDASNQEWMSDVGKELMPMWCPLTPPQSDNDVYIDTALGFLYESTIMSESELPPVYVKKELKRSAPEAMANCDREGRRPLKVRLRDEPSSQAPRSLFDRPSPALIKMRRDHKLQKCRGIVRSPTPIVAVKPTTTMKPAAEQDHTVEWLIYEDHTLLKEVQGTQEITLNLMVVTPAHIPNWDYLSETVTSVGRIYRSPKQCRSRYESIIIPREEGKLAYNDPMQKKKKLKSMYSKAPQTKSNRPLRTAQLYAQDNNQSFSSLYLAHFEVIRTVSNKRSPTVKPLLVNPAAKNPKHAAVLAEAGIDYDRPLEPQDVATRRADRIAREKQKNQAAAAKAVGATTSTAAAAVPATPPASTAGTSTVSAVTTLPVATVQPTPQQLQPAASPTPPVSAMVSVGTPQLRAHRPVTALMMQEVVRTVGSTPTVVSLASLTPAQLQAATQVTTPRLTTAQPSVSGTQTVTKTVTTGMVTSAGKTLNNTQLQFYRQQALKKHREQLKAQAQAAGSTSPAASTVTANVTPTQTVQVVQAVQPVQSIAVASTATTPSAISAVQKIVTAPVVSAAAVASTVAVVASGVASTSTAGLPVGVSTVAGVTTVQVTPGQQQRTQMQYMKHTIGTKQGIPRPLTENEMAILVKRQQVAAAAAAAAGTSTQTATATTSTIAAKPAQLTTAQLLAQAGLTVQTGAAGSGQTPVALVKTVSSAGGVTLPVSGMTIPQLKATLAPGVKAAPQQIRQLTLQQLQQRKLPPGQKVAQVAQVKGGSTQVLFHSQKAMTVQQIQQVMKHVQPGQAMQTVVSSGSAAGQVISHVLTKAPQVSAAGRVVPAAQRQTVQMMATSQGVTRASVPNVTVDASGRVQTTMPTTLTSALATTTGTIKVSSPVTSAMLSQAVAALQNPTSMVVRPNPVRIHPSAPLMAVTVQQPAVSQASASNVVTSQQQFQQIQLQLQQQQQQSQNPSTSSDNASEGH